MHPHGAYLPMLLFQDYLMAANDNSPNRKMSGLDSFKACLWHISHLLREGFLCNVWLRNLMGTAEYFVAPHRRK